MKTIVKILVLVWVSGLWLTLGSVMPVEAGSAWKATHQLEAAILKEDWRLVNQLLEADKSDSPAAALLKAHALLAENRNNESLCLFSQRSSAGDLQAWDRWTDDFVEGHPEVAVSHYLKGDASARLEQWDRALVFFKRALDIEPKHALVLNARGVVYAAQHKWNHALADFDAASTLKPRFADAYANRGALYIHWKTGDIHRVRGWFERALKDSPEFALALNGKGAMEFLLGRWGTSQADLKAAKDATDCAGRFVEANATAILDYMNGRSTEAPMLAEGDPGTTLDKRFEAMTSNPTQWNTNRFVSDFRAQSPATQKLYADRLQNFVQQNPGMGPPIYNKLDNVAKLNGPGGVGQTFWNLVPNIPSTNSRVDRLAVTQGNYDAAGKLQTSIESRIPPVLFHTSQGGVTSNMENARLDDGQWAVVTAFGLLYRVKATDAMALREGD